LLDLGAKSRQSLVTIIKSLIIGDFFQNIKTSQLVEPETTRQGSVDRYSETGIDMLIVGAGVGGLTTALECYRKGHNVRIYEREPSISAAGKYNVTFDQTASTYVD